MSESQGKSGSDTFDFEVTTKTSRAMDMEYSIILDKLEVDEGYSALNDGDINLYLTDESDNELVTLNIGDIAENNYVIYSDVNEHDNENSEITDRYSLRVWIDSGVDASDWNMNTKLQYKFRVNVNVSGEENKIASQYLMRKVGADGLEVVTHAADSTLQIGATSSVTEYRYRGSTPNNYVYFNCNDIENQSSSTCELYRIIGVFPVDDGTGNIENRVKLIKAENYGNSYWDTASSKNNWARPTTLNTAFNETYWKTINEDYQELVGDTKYYLGGYNRTDMKTNAMYVYERKISGSTYYFGGNSTNWTGKVALMYASDYGYAASSVCSESYNLYNSSGSDYSLSTCTSNNWLYLGSNEWLLPQDPVYADVVFYIVLTGYVYVRDVDSYTLIARPVFYLTSSTQIVDGDGTSGNPYQLG